MSPLRAFIAKREREIREQIKGLRAELEELKAVKQNLDGARDPQEGGDDPSPSGPTIKDMIRSVLTKRSTGLGAGDILMAIEEDFGAKLERTSLSPQLSRLRQSGDVVLNSGLWFPSQAVLAGWAAPTNIDLNVLLGLEADNASDE